MSLDAFAALDNSMFESIVNQAEEEKGERDSARNSGGRDFDKEIPRAFLPEGTHVLRILSDPELRMYRMVQYFTVRDPYKVIMDPRFFKKEDGTYRAGDVEIDQEIIERTWDLTRDLHHSYTSRSQAMFYAMLYETDSENDYWKAGNLYCVLSPARFESAWMTQMATHVKNPEIKGHIANSINPTKDGWAWTMTVVKGSQGSISLSPTFMKNYPAPEMENPEYYVPLSEKIVKEEFNLEDFHRIEEHLKAARLESGLDEDEAPEAPDGDDTGVPSDDDQSADTESSGKSSTTQDDQSADTESSGKSGQDGGNTSVDNSTPESSSDQSGTADGAVANMSKDGSSDNSEDPSSWTQYNLTDQEAIAARASGKKYKEFAELLGRI